MENMGEKIAIRADEMVTEALRGRDEAPMEDIIGFMLGLPPEEAETTREVMVRVALSRMGEEYQEMCEDCLAQAIMVGIEIGAAAQSIISDLKEG